VAADAMLRVHPTAASRVAQDAHAVDHDARLVREAPQVCDDGLDLPVLERSAPLLGERAHRRSGPPVGDRAGEEAVTGASQELRARERGSVVGLVTLGVLAVAERAVALIERLAAGCFGVELRFFFGGWSARGLVVLPARSEEEQQREHVPASLHRAG